MKLNRLRRAWGPKSLSCFLLAASILAGSAAAGQAAQDSSDRFVPAPPEAGTAIPGATIKFGMRPYADNTPYVIGMKKGWFKEVGISFTPPPYGLKANDSNVLTLMLNGQLDMISEYCPLFLPTYRTSRLLKCIAFTDNNQAFAILANPKLHLKTFKDYIAEGKSFSEALKLALAPLAGKTLVGAPELSARPFEETLGKLSGLTWNLQVLDDSKSLVLAQAGRELFVNPEGAPITYTLRQAGWTDVVDIGDLVKYGPGGTNSPLEDVIDIVGIAARSDYVNTNQNTVLRFLSVVWRIFDATAKDPSLYDIQAPYLNSFAGTSLDGKGVANTVNILDPFTPFDEDKVYYDEPANLVYYKSVWSAIIADLEQHHVIPAGVVKPDDVVWGAPIWHEMTAYRDKTNALLTSLSGKSLSADKTKLVDQAKTFYTNFDYLDSYRLALAASQ
ncbi:hypothetical protein ACELLULO517_13960 [Acidisoma cellulosilytica]|uniref:ABC transporter substrate-binding protein n=1 Tax=Acidisoma cellulosilyticum TaxID=2802395 RepID=A0A963Z2I9_9PROT|nr:hypothetical protein [Acidisoma cellulosilyticum]MCB8881349.1 hypothetical protein [Acidisoma cellulosilyticum]